MDIIIRKPCRPTDAAMQLRRDDRGVTLPEVLVTIAILAIIIVPLSDALIGFVRNTDATTRRMNESHDMQIATAYFAQDIQSLGVRDWSSPTLALQQSIDNPSYPCTGAGTSVISLAWDDLTSVSSPPTVVRVNYVVRDVGGEHQLRRLLQAPAGGSATVSSPTSSSCTTWSARPTRACTIRTTCTSASVPQRVTLTMTVRAPGQYHRHHPHAHRTAETDMTPRRFCVRPHDDRGTSLVLALVFITVLSLVLMSVLAFADTSMRSTIALRSQTSETAAAEGAAQAAINALRKGTYNGNSAGCFGGRHPP